MGFRKESQEGMTNSGEIISSFPLLDIPEIKPGDSIGSLIVSAMRGSDNIEHGDIFVVASKIVSKAEGAIVDLRSVIPSKEAIALSRSTNGQKSPELCEVIIGESIDYIVSKVIVCRHKLGFQLTSAGVDRLNNDYVAILPRDPDNSAKTIMDEVGNMTGKKVAVVISDSEGRPDREGAGAISIGVAGIRPLRIVERQDETGMVKISSETISDLLAASAALQMGQRGNNTPIVRIRGFQYEFDPEALLRTIIHSERLLG